MKIMNRWENGIISVYKIADHVNVLPRWVKKSQHRAHSAIYQYEVDTIYRGSISEKVHSTRLPLALY